MLISNSRWCYQLELGKQKSAPKTRTWRKQLQTSDMAESLFGTKCTSSFSLFTQILLLMQDESCPPGALPTPLLLLLLSPMNSMLQRATYITAVKQSKFHAVYLWNLGACFQESVQISALSFLCSLVLPVHLMSSKPPWRIVLAFRLAYF